MDHGKLGLAAPSHHGHYPIAFAEALGAWSPLDHFTGQLEPGDVRGGARRGRIATPALVHVGPVEAGRSDSDQHLAGAGPGIRAVGYDQTSVRNGCSAHRNPAS